MKRLAISLPIALAFGAMILVPKADAQPTPINACQIIANPGSYVLTGNLANPAGTPVCLSFTANGPVSIDLAGFSVIGNARTGTGILATGRGKVVRNGSISGFSDGVDFSLTTGSVVERLQVFDNSDTGINVANGIVRDNVVEGNGGHGILTEVSTVTGNYLFGNAGMAIVADGLISGNIVNGDDRGGGIRTLTGSTVIGNDVRQASFGITANCPSNLINNTAVQNTT